MTIQQQVDNLQDQINKVSGLEIEYNPLKYKAWHQQTLMLVRTILGPESSEANEIRSCDGRSNFISFGEPAEDERNNKAAYIRDLQTVKSLLMGVRDYLDSIDDINPDQIAVGSIESLHKDIISRCASLYQGGHFAEAVEKGFKTVKDRLRYLTDYEKAHEAFGRGGLYIEGASAQNVDDDFQKAAQYLMMAIDMFRNEKSHTADGKIEDPVRAYEYLALSSLAMHLLDQSTIKVRGDKDQSKS